MPCSGSGIVRHVSDYDVMLKKSECPVCHKKVKISIPNKEWEGNKAKFSRHIGDSTK